VATTFSGVDHRLELVRELAGVRWYDDSIATAPERSLAAMRSFEDPIILLAGGRDKDLPWDAFAEEVVHQVRHLITFGEAGSMIAEKVAATKEDAPAAEDGRVGPRLHSIARAETLERAVEAAERLAEPGDVVLLSPGGTSFDAYRDFAERGEHFKALVQQLQEGR
jgi:UDP-N-acetylmuramoylalanine--D-glutamate ligase